jgi:hypothetical protein
LIALNMGSENATVRSQAGVVLLSTFVGRDGQAIEGDAIRLSAGEAIVVSV